MVSDPRLRIRTLIQRIFDDIQRERNGSPEWSTMVRAARKDASAAGTVRARYRSMVIAQLPGCAITFGRQWIYIYLPDRYPQHEVPVAEMVPPAVIECLSPLGFSNTTF